MNWTDKIDQQRNALLLNFFMFVAMALVIIRTGLDVRGVPASFSYTPYDSPLDDDHLSPAQCDQLYQLYAETLALLYAAELVARRLSALRCEIYELMKRADVLAQSLYDRAAKAVGQCDALPAKLKPP